jgi:hypothetical protein
MKTGTERGGLVTLLNEPYLAPLFNYLPSPPSSPAVWAMSVVVTVAYIAAVVELSLACLCSQLHDIVKPQYQDFEYVRSVSVPMSWLLSVPNGG